MRQLILTSTIAAMLAVPAVRPAAAQVTVTTGTPTSYVGPIGQDSGLPGIPTLVAQTFLAPDDYLQSFTVYFTNFINGGGAELSASVYAFDTDHLTGSALFTSALFSGTDSFGDEPVTFGTDAALLNIALSPDVTYALVLSSLDGVASAQDGSTVLFGATDTAVPGGGLFLSFASDPADLSQPGAFVDSGSPSAAFSATFTDRPVVATPEPASLVLVASGFVGVGGLAMRRRRA